MKDHIEKQVADALLEKPITVALGGRQLEVAPPSIATLIEVSEKIATLPELSLKREKITMEVLSVAKDCRPIGDIIAIIILGGRITPSRKRWWSRWYATSREEEMKRLSRQILEELPPKRVSSLFVELLSALQVSDFFALTTSLLEINLLKETREVETTASGQ